MLPSLLIQLVTGGFSSISLQRFFSVSQKLLSSWMPRGRRYCGSPSYTVVLFKNFSQKNPVFSVDPLLNVSLDRCLSSFSTNTRCSTSTITSYSPLSFLRRAKKSRMCWFTCVNEFVLINNLRNSYIV